MFHVIRQIGKLTPELEKKKKMKKMWTILKRRETDRQTDRQTETETDRETYRETEIEKDRDRERQRERETERQRVMKEMGCKCWRNES